MDELTEAMRKIFTYYHNPVYGNQYQELVSGGLQQAKKFSWQKTAQEVLKTIEIVVSNPKGWIMFLGLRLEDVNP